MSPTLNGSSAIQRFECNDVIKYTTELSVISIQNCPMYHTVRNVREAEIFEIFTIKHQVAKISSCENFFLLKCFPDKLRKLSTLLFSRVFKDIELTSLCQRSINQTAENISGKQPMINLPFTSLQLQTYMTAHRLGELCMISTWQHIQSSCCYYPVRWWQHKILQYSSCRVSQA